MWAPWRVGHEVPHCQEMAVAKTEEADAQADYEETVKDAAKKREAQRDPRPDDASDHAGDEDQSSLSVHLQVWVIYIYSGLYN